MKYLNWVVLILSFSANAQTGGTLLEAGVKTIETIETSGDTLFIQRCWYEWDAPFGKNKTCLLMGCESDHKTYHADRLVFLITEGDVTFLRRDVGKEVFGANVKGGKAWRF